MFERSAVCARFLVHVLAHCISFSILYPHVEVIVRMCSCHVEVIVRMCSSTRDSASRFRQVSELHVHALSLYAPWCPPQGSVELPNQLWDGPAYCPSTGAVRASLGSPCLDFQWERVLVYTPRLSETGMQYTIFFSEMRPDQQMILVGGMVPQRGDPHFVVCGLS